VAGRRWGPGRKYYVLTDAGHQELQGTAARWSGFVEVTGAIIAGRRGVVEHETDRTTAEVVS
jgi:DNA-binding PadR family transcriptional regulator